MRKGVKLLLGTLVLTGGVGASAMISTPANATSCFWTGYNRTGSQKCFNDDIANFKGYAFPNGEALKNASSWENFNWVVNEFVYDQPNWIGSEQELVDESHGNLIEEIDNDLESYDAG